MNGAEIDAFEKRFKERVNRNGVMMPHMRTRCWEWTGGKDNEGYGTVALGGRTEVTHRVSWFLETLKWPKKWILHHCDNPACVRKLHLYEGDAKKNARDRVARNRSYSGLGHWQRVFERDARIKRLRTK